MTFACGDAGALVFGNASGTRAGEASADDPFFGLATPLSDGIFCSGAAFAGAGGTPRESRSKGETKLNIGCSGAFETAGEGTGSSFGRSGDDAGCGIVLQSQTE